MGKLYPNIKIVGAENGAWNKDKAFEIMNSFLQNNKELNAVFAVNDNMAEGAMVAAEAAVATSNPAGVSCGTWGG